MTLALLVTLKVAVGLLIFAIGLGSTVQDVTYLWRRPGLMIAIAGRRCTSSSQPSRSRW